MSNSLLLCTRYLWMWNVEWESEKQKKIINEWLDLLNSKVLDVELKTDKHSNEVCGIKEIIESNDKLCHQMQFHVYEPEQWTFQLFINHFMSLFTSLLNSGLKESISDALTLECGVAYAMTKAIKLICTGNLSASVDDIQDALEIADYLQLEEMIDICLGHFQVPYLTQKNCENIWLLVSQCDLPIYDTVLHFDNGHLPELLPGDDLIQLLRSSLLDMGSDQPLSYVKGEDFYHFVFRYSSIPWSSCLRNVRCTSTRASWPRTAGWCWMRKDVSCRTLSLLLARLINRNDVEFDEYRKFGSLATTESVSDPAAKSQLPFGYLAGRNCCLRWSVKDSARS